MKSAQALALLFVSSFSGIIAETGATIVYPSDPRLHWSGRKLLNATVAQFDWVGVGFSLRLAADSEPGTVSADIDGHGERFTVYVNGLLTKDFFAEKRSVYILATAKAGNIVTLVKSTEDKIVQLSSLQLGKGVKIGPFEAVTSRRLEIWGDSDTAAFGVDSSWWNVLGCAVNANKYENFAHGWVQGVLRALGAEAQIQAISGIGVVKNAGGAGITLPKLVGRTLHNLARDDCNASAWEPSLVVVYVGSNDYVNFSPPSESTFKDSYRAMMKNIVGSRQSVNVLHLCGMEATPCGYIKALAAESGHNYSTTMDPDKAAACVGHRTAKQQAALALRLAPVIAKAAGWVVASKLPVLI